MKKSHHYTDVSKRICTDCGEKHIKTRMVEKRDARICYECFTNRRKKFNISATVLKQQISFGDPRRQLNG